MDKAANLANIGDWPALTIPRSSHRIIRHAYEQVLTACARLISFAAGGEPTTDGPIGERQETLAVEDLIEFAIHARRLIDSTVKGERRFANVSVHANKRRTKTVKVRKIINVLIHNDSIRIVRSEWDIAVMTQKSPFERLAQPDKIFPPFVIVKSHRDDCVFDLTELIETFQHRILVPITDLCAEHHLFLDESRDD
jgi:hypothetical protein